MKQIYSFAKLLMALLLMCLPSQVSAQTFEELAGTWSVNIGSSKFTTDISAQLPKNDWEVTITTEEKDGKQMAYMKGFLGTVKLADGTESAWTAEFKEEGYFKKQKTLTFKLPDGATCYTDDGATITSNASNPEDYWVVSKSSDGKLTVTSSNYVLYTFSYNSSTTNYMCFPIMLTRTGDLPTEPVEPTEPKPLGEALTSLDDASLEKTYALYNPASGAYVSYNANFSPKIWISGYTGTPDYDATSTKDAWMVAKATDGKYYLYNLGNKQYFNTPGWNGIAYACQFSAEPVALEVVDNGDGNFALTADKGREREPGQYVGYAHVATNLLGGSGDNQRPVTVWTSDAGGSQFQLKENPNVPADQEFAEKWTPVATPEFSYDPAPGHFETMPQSFVVRTGVTLDPTSVVVNYTSSKVDVAELPADQVTVDADSVKFTLPAADVENASQLTLAIQMKDTKGNVLTNGDDPEYVLLEYTADVKTDTFTLLSSDPENQSTVEALETVKLTMNGAASNDYVGGFDSSKQVQLFTGDGQVVTTATLSRAEAEGTTNDVVVTLAEKVTKQGEYRLVIPAGAIYNKKYDEIEPDFGVAYGATYNPEISLSFRVQQVASFTLLSAEPAADSKVSSLKTVKVTMNGAATNDAIGGFDNSKVITVLGAEGETVTTATIDFTDPNDFSSNDATITLADEVTLYGQYTLVIPEATIYNSLFDDSAEDFGVSFGATYNPEIRLTYNVRVDDGYTFASTDPADGSTVNELSVINVTMKSVEYHLYDYVGGLDPSQTIEVKNANGDVVTTAKVYYLDDTVYDSNLTLTLKQKQTQPGTYTIVVPEKTIFSGPFVYGSDVPHSYNPELTLTYTIDAPAAPELGEPIASLADASTEQTYVLYNRANDTYAIWDEAYGNKVWAAGANGRFDTLDRTAAGSSWMLVEKDGKYYLYNMGGKMYLSTPGWPERVSLACRFAEGPVALTAVELGDGKFAFTSTGVDHDYMCAAPDAAPANPQDGERPITIWTADTDGSAWELLPNPNVAADPAVVDEVATGINQLETATTAKGIYTLQGVKLNTTDVKSLSKGLYIIDGKKVLVK